MISEVFGTIMETILASLTLIGLISVGVFFLLPKKMGEINPLYKCIAESADSYFASSDYKSISSLSPGELVVIIRKGELLDNDAYNILIDIGITPFQLASCMEEGCVLRFIINNKRAYSCLFSYAYLQRSYKGTFRTKTVGFFNSTDFLECFSTYLPLVTEIKICPSPDCPYTPTNPLRLEGKKLVGIFSNSTLQLEFKRYITGEVTIK